MPSSYMLLHQSWYQVGSYCISCLKPCCAVADAPQALRLVTEVNGCLNKPAFSAALDSWLSQLLSSDSSLPAALHSYASLLQSCNRALDMVKDVGYEGALHCLGSACLEASKASQEQAAQQTPQQTAQQASQPAAEQAAHQVIQQPATPAAQPAAQHPANITSHGLADTQLTVAMLLEALSVKVCSLSNVLHGLDIASERCSSTFPKFQKLVQFLAQLKADKPAWHGMVFVKERQAVFQLTKMLQATPQLAGVNFYPFTGDGKTAQKYTAGSAANSITAVTPVGMKLKERKSTMLRFHQAKGQEVLVATSAAEEGIDVPSCEFMVCYTAVQSGRELTQRQGRARALVSKFVEFDEEGSTDAAMQRKAREEQMNSQLAQKLHLQNGRCCQQHQKDGEGFCCLVL